MADLTPDVVALQESLKIPPAEQARRDAIARQVIASEGEGEDLGVINIGLERKSERPIRRADMRLRGSSDINAPTLSANDYQSTTNEPKQPKLKFVGYDGEEPAPTGKQNLKYMGLDGETPQDKPAAPKLRKAGELKYLGLDNELNPPAEPVNQPAQQEGATFGDRAKDLGIGLAQGVVAVPEAVVGLANIPTGGAVGKFMEDNGVRFKDTQEILDNWRSDAGKQAQQNFADAEGFYDAGKAAIQNPSVIADGIVKSIPSIGGGSVFGRALIYAFPKLVGAIGAGAVGEGVMSAGSSAENFRQQSETGYTTNEQNALAAATGLSIGLIGKFSGGVAAKLGINDIDNVLINGSADQVEQVVKKSLGRKLAEGGFSEGILEEMPQSAIETLISNVALDRPIMEGVQESAAIGALTGGAMGVGAQLIQPKPALSRGQQIIQKLKAQKGIVEPPIAQAAPQNEMLSASDLLDEPAPDQPTPEPQVTLEAQTQAFIDGTKPAILLTEGEKYPEGLPADVKTAEVDKGILIYSDDATLELAQNGKLGQALGYGIDEKPTGTNQTVTARNADGVVIQDVLTDGSQSVIDAATKVAGADGTVEVRSADEAIAEREAVKADDDEGQFPPQTQTLGVPRAEMPQIKAVHRGAMVNFLNARGITHQQETVTPESLKPTQAEYSKSKVKKAEEYTGTNRSVLISADNHVLDGHHQWLAKMNKGEDIDVIRLNSPIKDLLETVKEFPSATLSDDENSSGPQAGSKQPVLEGKAAPVLDSTLGIASDNQASINQPEVNAGNESKPVKKARTSKAKKSNTLLATLRNSGGILLSDKLDVTGEDKKFAPGSYNNVFKNDARQSLKSQIESGNLDDYLPPAMRLSSAIDEAFDSTDAYDYLAERIKNGDSVIPFDVEQEINAQKFFKQQELTAQEVVDILSYELDEESANEQFRIASNEERESAESFGQPTASATQDTTASDNREPASGEIQPVIQSAPVAKTTSEKTEREGVRALVETIAKNRAASNEINKAKYFNERLQDAKDFMAGKDVKPARFVDAALTFTKYEPIKAAFTELSRMAKEPAKEARKATSSLIDDYKAKIAAAKTGAELTALGTAVQKDSTLTDAQAIKLDDLIAEAQDNLTVAVDEGSMNKSSWYGEFERAKKDGDLKALDILYNKVKVALNGFAQGKGDATVKQFEKLKKDLESYAEELKQKTPKPALELSGQTNAEIEADIKAERDAKAAEEAAIAKDKADKDAKGLAEQVKKNAGERDFVFGEAKKDTVKAIKGGMDDMFAEPVNPKTDIEKLKEARELLSEQLQSQGRVTDARTEDRLKEVNAEIGKIENAEPEPKDLLKAAQDSGRLEIISVTDKKQFADNKVFTASAVEKARARLKSKLGNLNTGLDPELLVDGMTIAGAYIESGVRSFSAYAKAMTADFGDSIKPYLLSFYEAARAYPGIDKSGMTDAETAEKEYTALLTPAVVETVKEVVGAGIVETPKVKAKPNGQLTLTQDWGVEHIDGHVESSKFPTDNSRENAQSGLKLAFLAEAKKYLVQVEKLLETQGFTPHVDRRGRLQKAVSVNEAGVAVSGEVSLTMLKGDVGVYVDIGTSAIRGLTGNHPQAVSVMARVTGRAKDDQFAGDGQNNWLRTDLNATTLAGKLLNLANNVRISKGNENATADTAGKISADNKASDLLAEQPRSGDSKPLDNGLARESKPADQQRAVPTSVQEPSGSGTQRTSGNNGDESSSGSRKTSDTGNNTSAAASDAFEIGDEVGLGEGTAAKKLRDNINAIKLIKALEAENRTATPDERNQLAKYTGFGALSAVFERNNKDYAELKALLTPEEYDSARASILNAYYTSKTLVDAMYNGVAHLGFKGGRVLEPSLGSGNFFGLMPAGLRNKSQLNGVELDSITSRLAKALYPQAKISTSTGFEKYQAPEGYFDLVVGNPPFGSEKITDADKRGYSGFSIHNYFLAKSIDKLRDGGIMSVVVSHSFMDAKNSAAREWIAQRANLVAGIRLPSDAFKANAGTEVITDILYFQKTATPEKNPTWIEALDADGYTFNDYFIINEQNVLGKVEDTTNQFGKTFTVKSTGDLAKQLKAITAEMPQNIYVAPTQRVEVLNSADNTVPDGVKVGTFYSDSKGNIRQRLPDQLGDKQSQAWEPANAKAKERMAGMMDIRDLLRSQMRLERDPMATEKLIEQNREKLNKKYDSFLKEFGYLNSATNRRLFLDDTESALVQALEFDYDQGVTKVKAAATGMDEKEPSAVKADIFKRRVLFPPSDSITVNNAKDALLESLNVKGSVDIDFMAELYSKPAAEIIKELGDVLFDDPQKGLVTADEYLSGDVKTKLAEAQHALKSDKSQSRNVEALEKVIPKDKLPSEIFASAGANWIPAKYYDQFAAEVTGIPPDGVEFTYVKAAAMWLYEKRKTGDAGKLTSDFGTAKIDSFEMFGLLINGKSPEVKKSAWIDGKSKPVTDVEQTDLARAKYQKMKEHWNSWIFSDPDRADELATIYNEKHNRVVSRKFDGAHMNFYGMSPSITLIPSQKDVVWRAIQDRNVLLDHVVGAGKAQPLDAKILTPKGYKLMGDIKVGDYVISVDGKPTLVEAVFPQGEKEIFKVSFSDGSSTECCDEHLWKTQNYYERNQANSSKRKGKNWDSGNGKVRSLSEIKATLVGRLGAKNHSIPIVEPVKFKAAVTPIHPYLMGALLGDGGFSHDGVTITSADIELIEHCQKVLPNGIKLNPVKTGEKCQTWTLTNEVRTRNKPSVIKQGLSDLELRGLSSHDKFIPEIYLLNSIENRIELLRGLMDTDGTVNNRGTSIYYYTVSDKLADDVVYLVNSLGGVVKRTIKKPTYTHLGIKKTGRDCHVLCISLPPAIQPFKLSRKAVLVKPKSSYAPVRYIVSVESVGLKEAQCIRVAHESHLYVTDDFIVTHNTFAMAASAMEMKRLGIARKPMFVVPNHLTLQWRSEFTRLYPASNILAATPDDFAKDRREKMFSKMVTGGYDAIVIGHSSIKKVGLPADVEQRMYDEQVKEISDAIEIAKSERGDRGITRDMEKIKKNLEAKITKLKEKAGNKDDVVGFDELGVDAMFIDEMHEFKNLFFTTQMQRTSGLGNPAGSGKALDLFMKVRYMQETHGENVPLITATGTPVSNSLAEMYTMQRYMKYDELKRADLHLFDAWAKQYGEVEQVYEVAPSGVGYRQSTRFSKFKNLPSLMASYNTFADVITLQDLKDQAAATIDPKTGKRGVFPVPKLKTGKPMNVVAQRSILQRDFFGVPQLAVDESGNIKFEINPMTSAIEKNNEGKFVLKFDSGLSLHETQEEAELELVTKSLTPQTFIDPDSLLGQFANLAELTRETKGKINALSLTSLANKAGLDYRIIDPSAPDHPDSKINMAVNNAVELWQETTKDKGTQIVFCDMSIPNSARGDMSSKERRIYVRDRNGLITHKAKGVVYAAQGFEGFPFYITKGRDGFVVYEALTGLSMRDFGLDSKDAAKDWVNRYIEISGNRDRIYGMRDINSIDSTDVDEYRDAQELEVAEDGSNEIGMADLEALAGSSRFSVYDDMKAKLIARGVPEVQIAFIHDYGTPKQKEELFKRMKRGDIRFLFGSTPKLGAGTNVQNRLVGLHHIDAPWRPSDLEQREGRIIRQGNELYQRDPDGFEVSVWRYATEQTYDTRRWQLLEHKAAGIEQLRKYSGEAEIEDVDSEASNSADMKAAASGNPLILEETKLRTEVKRLVNMERGFADSKYSMARKIKANDRDIAEYWPNKIDEYQSFIDATKAFPIPDDKTKIATIVVDGEKLANREKAENAIGLLATKVRQSFEANNTKEVVYRGVPFAFRRGFNIGTLMLESPDGMMHTYLEKDSLSPSGLITRLNNYIDSFGARIENIQVAIGKAKLENEQLKPRLNEPFEDVQLLKDTQAKHASVQRRLMKSSQLEAVPESQIAEFKKILKERKANLVSMGFDKAIKESEKDGDADFSQGSGKGNLLIDDIKAAIKADTFGQEIDIYPSLMDAPIDIQRQIYSEGAAGVEGFFDRSTNRVALIASNIKSLERAREVARHELIGHYGIENMLNDEDPALFKKLVNRVQFAEKNGNKVIVDIGKQVDATRNQELSPARRAREIIAVMAERNLQNSIVKRVLDSIRRFLNKYTSIKSDMTDSDVAELLRDAQKYLKKQGRSIANGSGTDFSQVDQTSTPNFKKWFEGSQVVNSKGKPLVVYHGSPNRGKSGSFGSVGNTTPMIADNRAFFVTEDVRYADRFARGGRVEALYLAIKNPVDLTDTEVTSNLLEIYNSDNSIESKWDEDYEGDISESAYVLLESKSVVDYLKENGFDGAVMDEDLELGVMSWAAFSPNQIKSATNNNGNFDPNSDRIDFSQSAPRQGRLTPQWNSLEASKMDSVIYTLQDKSIDLKRVTQAIKKAGNNISDRWNAYLQEELYHGRTAKRTQDFIKNDLDPLIEAMRLRGVAMADFEEYLWARHAEERNIQIAKINPDMPDGGSGMKTADAQAYMDGLTADQKAAYEALAKRIDAINRKSRQVLIDYGLESTATIAAWNAAYKNYVPLMREDMDAGFGNGTGSGFSVKGNASKRATGSNRAVVDIIANIAQQFEKNLIRGEKNRVSTALIGLAKLNPNESFWSVDTPPTIKSIGKVSGLVEVHTDPNYKNRDNVVVARIPDKLGRIQERAVVFNQFDERAMRMSSSIKNLDQDQIGEILGAAASVTRWFAAVNTQYNPIFGVINILRDVQGSMLNLSSTPLKGKKSAVMKGTLPALAGIYKDLRSVRAGKGAAKSQWALLFEEFEDEGGQTGYRDLFRNAEQRANKLKKTLDPTWWQETKTGKFLTAGGLLAKPEQWIFEKSQEWIFNWLTDYNTALENAVRLSVYKTAKDNGQTKQQAASLAKNISVNFNRKGEIGRQAGALYAFFNASVQGTARISETLFKNDNGKVSLSAAGLKIISGGLLLGVMQALALSLAGYDDEEPPEFVKDKSIIVPLDMFGADGKYISLAMPLGFNAIPSFGRIVTEWAMDGFSDTSGRLTHILGMLLDVTNPIGNAGLSLQTITPTVLDPFAALAENKDFAGRNIAQEDFNSLKPTPGHSRAKDTATVVSKGLSYALNSLTGGNEYTKGAFSPTPDQIDYLIGQVFGGVGREIMKTEQTLTSAVTGEDLPVYKIPLVGRFGGNAKSNSAEKGAYYKNIIHMNEIEAELKGRIATKDDVADFKADNPEHKLIGASNVAEANIAKLKKRRKALIDSGAAKERVKMVDELIVVNMKKLNERISAAEN